MFQGVREYYRNFAIDFKGMDAILKVRDAIDAPSAGTRISGK
jgi:hypothetical protein